MVVIIGSVYAGCNYSDEDRRASFDSFLQKYEADDFLQHYLKLHFTNGEYFLQISYLGNRNGESVDAILNFFKFEIPAMLGLDAFGLIYIYDDEGGRKVDEFELYTLKKGLVQQEVDAYFSPFSILVSPEQISQF